MKLLLILIATSLVLAQASNEKKVVCYWGSWSVGRENNGKFDLSYVDPKLCTHLIYTFIGLPEGGAPEVISLSPKVDFQDGNIQKFNKLREQNPELKTMVAIGGWSQGSAKYSKIAADPNLRKSFVDSVVAFVKKHGFDGLDVDWEYPVQGGVDNGGRPVDYQNYVTLLKELRERLHQDDLLLSAAVAAPESLASHSYDIPQISKYLDFINVMAYDLHGAWDGKTGMHAAIHPALSETGFEAKVNIDSIINYWLSAGAPAEKLVLGVPFYGKTFTLSNPQSNSVGAPASDGPAGPYTRAANMMGYNEICEKFKQENWNVEFDEERRVPYAYKGNEWISYDNEQSIKEKAELIKKYNLGGGMVWSIETDDFRGICGPSWPLLTTLSGELRNGVSPKPSVPRPKAEAQKSQPKKPNTSQPKPSAPRPKAEAQKSQPQKPNTSQQSPKQQPANNGKVCQTEGDNKDPADCAKFYRCIYYDNDYISHSFNCPAGTLFDSEKRHCNHAAMVQC